MLATTLNRMEMVADQPGTDARDARWAAWMAAVQAGDAQAYDRLLRECLPQIRAVVRVRIRNAADAEDAVQDTLLSLHALRHTYDPARPFKPWLNAIAERRAIDRLRRLSKHSRREAALDDAPEQGTPATGTARLEAAELRAAVAELPESQRTALRLAKLEERPLKEAAQISGLSVGALKVATHRAVATLRAKLGGRDGQR
jgi:RNA polymerase sigma-70 factor (ECF subfamily)